MAHIKESAVGDVCAHSLNSLHKSQCDTLRRAQEASVGVSVGYACLQGFRSCQVGSVEVTGCLNVLSW